MLNLLFYSFWLKLKLLFRHKTVSIRSRLINWLVVNKCSCLHLSVDFPCIRRRQDGRRPRETIMTWEPLTRQWALVEGCWEAWVRPSCFPALHEGLFQWWAPSARAAAWNVFAADLAGHAFLLWMYLLFAVDGGWYLRSLVIPSGQPQSI